MSFGRNEPRKTARRAPFQRVNQRLLILCEGENTERQYIEGFAKKHRKSLVYVKIADVTGVPMTLVREAKNLRDAAADAASREQDRNLLFDQVWCVFDLDEHPNVTAAMTMARANGIKVALSVPCFELWLVLHFRDSPGMIHRHAVQKMLKKHIAGYDKSVKYEDYHAGYPAAVKRAERLDGLAKVTNDPWMNPTTGVHRLTSVICPPNPVSKQKKRRLKRGHSNR